ncbi:MAG TPA: O-acetyl-ADP-ribose deacetylase [Candidatus Angelobacter sp.]|jgi:O-acetyl-ADP-ribose deacetylase (regulator of RNase III)|nr:O-acetyl-ADP-ribose deacetylase [Candidatus Angelobacter sp.]
MTEQQHSRHSSGGNRLLELAIGDITEETTDAIVNAANSSLMGGGGVDGAIHRAAGPELLAECKKIRAQRGPLPAGQAVGTLGARLKAKYVIHTVGPVWQGGQFNEPQILENCYSNSMAEAARLGCTSISFPSVATGAYGYPLQDAAQIALRTVAEALCRSGSISTVRFVLFDQRTYKAYATAAEDLRRHFSNLRINLLS